LVRRIAKLRKRKGMEGEKKCVRAAKARNRVKISIRALQANLVTLWLENTSSEANGNAAHARDGRKRAPTNISENL